VRESLIKRLSLVFLISFTMLAVAPLVHADDNISVDNDSDLKVRSNWWKFNSGKDFSKPIINDAGDVVGWIHYNYNPRNKTYTVVLNPKGAGNSVSTKPMKAGPNGEVDRDKIIRRLAARIELTTDDTKKNDQQALLDSLKSNPSSYDTVIPKVYNKSPAADSSGQVVVKVVDPKQLNHYSDNGSVAPVDNSKNTLHHLDDALPVNGQVNPAGSTTDSHVLVHPGDTTSQVKQTGNTDANGLTHPGDATSQAKQQAGNTDTSGLNHPGDAPQTPGNVVNNAPLNPPVAPPVVVPPGSAPQTPGGNNSTVSSTTADASKAAAQVPAVTTAVQQVPAIADLDKAARDLDAKRLANDAVIQKAIDAKVPDNLPANPSSDQQDLWAARKAALQQKSSLDDQSIKAWQDLRQAADKSAFSLKDVTCDDSASSLSYWSPDAQGTQGDKGAKAKIAEICGKDDGFLGACFGSVQCTMKSGSVVFTFSDNVACGTTKKKDDKDACPKATDCWKQSGVVKDGDLLKRDGFYNGDTKLLINGNDPYNSTPAKPADAGTAK